MVKKHFSILLTFPVLCFLLIGCDNDELSVSDELLPLALGNRWYYEAFIYDEDPPRSYKFSMYTEHMMHMDELNVDAFIWMCSKGGYEFLKNHPDGLYIYGYGPGEEIFSSPRLYLKYPCSTGDVFEDYTGFAYKVISISEPVTVQAGNFTCIKYYKRPRAGHEIYEYYSPGIGRIKTEVFYDGVMFKMSELIRYEIGNGS